MATATKVSLEEFTRLQAATEESARYELDEGELLLTPSPTPRHNLVRYELRQSLTTFVKANGLGMVLDETDFRLSAHSVRKPDVAFLARERLENFDLDQTPIEGAPTLAVEIVSPSNSAQDIAKKVRQYLAAGCQSVWLVYPALRLVEIHGHSGMHDVQEPLPVTDPLLPGFSLTLDSLLGQ